MPHARRTWLWHLRRICLLLLLGLGTTIAVAWAAEVWSQVRWVDRDTFLTGSTEWFVDVPAHWPRAPEWCFASSGYGRTVTTDMAGDDDGFRITYRWQQEEVRVGFPLRSLRRVDVVNAPDRLAADALHLSRIQTGLPLPAWLVVDSTDNRRLPLMPLWPGLAANTLFYGLLWWLGLAQWRIVICNRRFRRGLCPMCRYDLGFNNTPGCPECGWRRA